jgi:hypothetical protein
VRARFLHQAEIGRPPGAREGRTMSERLVRGETAVEFFREQLERAMVHQKVSSSTFTQ